jgi:ribonuclease HI
MTCPDPSNVACRVVYCDGSASPNPGRMGIGAVIIEPNGTGHTLSQATHSKGCNNEAELKALLAALRDQHARGVTALLVHCYNSILVEQLGREEAKPIARPALLFDEARMLLKSFEHAHLQLIPRHRNGEADALVCVAVGIQPKCAVNQCEVGGSSRARPAPTGSSSLMLR